METLKEIFFRVVKSLTRTSSYVGKELIQVVRRPGAFFSLVLGPFLVMAIFGIGYNGVRRPLETVLVIPEQSGLQRDEEYYSGLAGPAAVIREVTGDEEAARDLLRTQQIDLLIVAPPDLQERFREGEQAVIRVEYNEIDPLLAAYADFLAYRLQQEVNGELLRRAVAEGQQYVVEQVGEMEATRITPEVIAAPTRAETVNVAQTPPSVVAFFAPAVLALILQHMAVTLTALSLVRERLSGAMELFRISPVNAMEIVLGKYIGFGLISGVIAAIVSALMIGVLGVPLIGDPSFFVLIMALVTFTALGLGLLISVVADSERQAVQLSLLVLLASVFFSGFVLPVDEFRPEVRYAAYALPVTHGIRLLQDVMLRGGTYAIWQLAVLTGVGVVLFLITAFLLRRSMARG
ncbi:ABC transporter permease [soil metagenome]